MLAHWIQVSIEQYGYIVVLLAVAIESTGIPFPGETALVAGAVYAGTGGHLSIAGMIAAAAAGAILGDNLGFVIGHFYGYALVHRLAPKLRLSERHLSYAEGFFRRHGDKTVFLGRFFAILRCWAAFLAGVNRMQWRTFLCWNALGGIAWATIYGMLGYALGRNLPLLHEILRAVGWGGTLALAALVAGLLICWLLWRRGALHAAWLDAAWERVGGWLLPPETLADSRTAPFADSLSDSREELPPTSLMPVLYEEPADGEFELTANSAADGELPALGGESFENESDTPSLR